MERVPMATLSPGNSDEHHCRNVTLLMSTGYMTWMPNSTIQYHLPRGGEGGKPLSRYATKKRRERRALMYT